MQEPLAGAAANTVPAPRPTQRLRSTRPRGAPRSAPGQRSCPWGPSPGSPPTAQPRPHGACSDRLLPLLWGAEGPAGGCPSCPGGGGRARAQLPGDPREPRLRAPPAGQRRRPRSLPPPRRHRARAGQDGSGGQLRPSSGTEQLEVNLAESRARPGRGPQVLREAQPRLVCLVWFGF